MSSDTSARYVFRHVFVYERLTTRIDGYVRYIARDEFSGIRDGTFEIRSDGIRFDSRPYRKPVGVKRPSLYARPIYRHRITTSPPRPRPRPRHQ